MVVVRVCFCKDRCVVCSDYVSEYIYEREKERSSLELRGDVGLNVDISRRAHFLYIPLPSPAVDTTLAWDLPSRSVSISCGLLRRSVQRVPWTSIARNKQSVAPTRLSRVAPAGSSSYSQWEAAYHVVIRELQLPKMESPGELAPLWALHKVAFTLPRTCLVLSMHVL